MQGMFSYHTVLSGEGLRNRWLTYEFLVIGCVEIPAWPKW